MARASTRPGRLLAGGRRAHRAERRRPAPRAATCWRAAARPSLPNASSSDLVSAAGAGPGARAAGLHASPTSTAGSRGASTSCRRCGSRARSATCATTPIAASTFLTLRDPDEGATLSVTMARWAFERLEPRPVEGQRVQVHGKVTLYDKRAELSLRADRIEPAGDGALLARIEEARRRLDADGLFEAGAQAPAAALAARHRADRGPRRGGAARRHPQRARPPRLGALRARRDGRAGRARRARDPARAGGARGARRCRRDRDHARRRLARGSAAVLGRAALPRDRRLLDGRRLGRRATSATSRSATSWPTGAHRRPPTPRA